MRNKQDYLKKLTHFFDEQTLNYLPVIDRVDEFKAKSGKPSAQFFLEKRKEKKKLLLKDKNLKKRIHRKVPKPGGVGYGVYYTDAYHRNFTRFTCIDFGLLVPLTVGGNNDNYIYLTATNGSAKGVEALVGYFSQDEPNFLVYDWAKPESKRWSRSIPLNTLAPNLSSVFINGLEHRCLRILNRTENKGGNIWENKVCLFNYQNKQWDLVYTFEYESSLAAQKHEFNGSWGPIVETFMAPPFTTLNPLGFFNSMLYNDANSPRLTVSNTVIHDDNDGIDIVYIDPNLTFIVA